VHRIDERERLRALGAEVVDGICSTFRPCDKRLERLRIYFAYLSSRARRRDRDMASSARSGVSRSWIS